MQIVEFLIGFLPVHWGVNFITHLISPLFPYYQSLAVPVLGVGLLVIAMRTAVLFILFSKWRTAALGFLAAMILVFFVPALSLVLAPF